MAILVQKFGGTSVADAHRIHLAARKAIRAKLSGKQVVLVVSAMGHETDRLVDLAAQVSRKPSKREMDMLLATGEQVSIALVAMAIHEAGHEAISMTGAQAGMRTDDVHTRARIRSIDTPRIQHVLDDGKIVIVAGFQGVTDDSNITTLGRGGSDTTAVALAAALRAEMCEIYTDVDGIYTTDPRIVPEARKLDAISYEEMLELASLGAGVMHGRSIEVGEKFGVPIHVRSSFTDTPGTMIMAEPKGMEDVVVRGATLKRNIGRITFVGLPAQQELPHEIFDQVAAQQISVDDIIQNVY
ncbi:MAG: aspartate kinase, partial [Planctomycetes bacterium]|nr:aspartate kinase [Planctomycetota bacterium]